MDTRLQQSEAEMKKLLIKETHGRSGFTRHAGAILDIIEEGQQTDAAISAYDAAQAVERGQAEYADAAQPEKALKKK